MNCHSCGMPLDEKTTSKHNSRYCIYCQNQDSGELKSYEQVRAEALERPAFLKPTWKNVGLTTLFFALPWFPERARDASGMIVSEAHFSPIILFPLYVMQSEWYGLFLMSCFALFIYIVVSLLLMPMKFNKHTYWFVAKSYGWGWRVKNRSGAGEAKKIDPK